MAKANPWTEMAHAVLRGIGQSQGINLPYSDPNRAKQMEAAQLDIDAAKARMANAASAMDLQNQQFGLSKEKFAADQAYKQQVLKATEAKNQAELEAKQLVPGSVPAIAGAAGGLFPGLEPDPLPPSPADVQSELKQNEYNPEGQKKLIHLGKIADAINSNDLRPPQQMELVNTYFNELEKSRIEDDKIVIPTMDEAIAENVQESPNGMVMIRNPNDGSWEHRDNTSKREELESQERIAKFNARSQEISQERQEQFQEKQVKQEADTAAAADKSKARQDFSKRTLEKKPWDQWLGDARKDLVQRYKDKNAGRKVQPWMPTPEQVEDEASWLYDQAFEKEYSKTQPAPGVVRKPIEPVDSLNKFAEDEPEEYMKQFGAMRTKMEEEQEQPKDGSKPPPVSDEVVFLELSKTRPEYGQQVGRRVAARMRAARLVLGPAGEEALRQQMLAGGVPPEAPPVPPGQIEMPPGEPPINPTQLAPGDMMMPAAPAPLDQTRFPVPPSGETLNINELSGAQSERLMRDAVPFSSDEDFAAIVADPRSYPGMPVRDEATGDVFQLKPNLFDDPMSRRGPSSKPMMPAKEQKKALRKRFGKEARRKVRPQVNEPKESALMSYLGGSNISFGGAPIPSMRKKKLDTALKKATKGALDDEKSRRQARGKLLDKAIAEPSSVDPEATALAIQEAVKDYGNLTKAQQRQIDKLIDPSGESSNGRAELQESLFR